LRSSTSIPKVNLYRIESSPGLAIAPLDVSDKNVSTIQSSGQGNSFNRGSLPGLVGPGRVSKKRSDLNLPSREENSLVEIARLHWGEGALQFLEAKVQAKFDGRKDHYAKPRR
jgi:hypothetical protein